MKTYRAVGKGWPSGRILPVKEDNSLVYTAKITNSLSDISRINEPARIAVNFARGVVKNPTRLSVVDDKGDQVPWQWEPTRHARTDVDISKWPDGSLKSGYVWVVVPSIAANGFVTYTITVNDTVSDQPAPQVSLTTSAGSDVYESPVARATFLQTWDWQLANFVDKVGNSDIFSAADAGIDFAYRHSNAATAEYVGLTQGPSGATTISKNQRDAGAFGAGVVYREFEVVNQFNTTTSVRTRTVYRIFATGRVDIWNTFFTTAPLASTDLKLFFSVIKPSATGGTHVTTDSNTKLLIKSQYGTSKFLSAYRSIKNGSDADGTNYGGIFPGTGQWLTASPIRLRAGGNHPTYATPAGSTKQQWLSVMRTDDYDAEELKFWNSLVASAVPTPSVEKSLTAFKKEAKDFLARYAAYSNEDNKSGDGWKQALRLAALVNYSKVGGPDVWTQVPAAIQAWLDFGGRGPADAGLGLRLFNNFKANNPASGWEHVGRDVQAFYQLRSDALARGDSTTAATCETIIKGIADHAVRCEADNGSTGRIVLGNGNPENPNATAEGLIALVFAHQLGIAEAGWAAVRDRIWSALLAGFQFRNWTPYLFTSAGNASGAITTQVLSYYHRVTLAIHIGRVVGGLSTNIDPAYSLLASVNPQGQLADNLDNYNFERRGSGATSMHFAANLAYYGGPSEIEQATRIMRHVREQTPAGLPSPYPIDGWANPIQRSIGDALCGMLMGLALNRLENT